MKRNLVKLSLPCAALVFFAGCSGAPQVQPQNSMISAAEFEAMINIEVRELEPLPVGEAVAAATN